MAEARLMASVVLAIDPKMKPISKNGLALMKEAGDGTLASDLEA